MVLQASLALADSIAPPDFSATLEVGQSTTLRKVVTVDEDPSTGWIDVMFVLDNTGSMREPLQSLRANIATVLNETAGLGEVRWGVAKFEDVPTYPWGTPADQPWTLVLQPTDNQADVAAALNFPIRHGEDGPEANLIALRNAATEVNWRPGAARYVVYLTDAYGHDPDTTPGYPGPTLQQTIDALVAANVKVLAFIPDSENAFIDSAEVRAQAAAIATATSGHLDVGDLSTWGARVASNVTAAVSRYNSVSLGLGNPAGVDVTAVPVNHPAGPYDRSVARSFEFDVTFSGVTPGTYDFTIDGLVDGSVVATETDRITVRAAPVHPVPVNSPLTLLAIGLGVLVAVRRMR